MAMFYAFFLGTDAATEGLDKRTGLCSGRMDPQRSRHFAGDRGRICGAEPPDHRRNAMVCCCSRSLFRRPSELLCSAHRWAPSTSEAVLGARGSKEGSPDLILQLAKDCTADTP